ncbi:MAG: hypothetical protein MK102_06535 [Fuerstiella sp.]|nr:hypothetical protein [Fuerstiella sp.]
MTAIWLVIEKIWQGNSLTGDDIVVLVLLLMMAASVMHLFTMLITRWGDRHIAFKSLAGSLLVHCVCILGLQVFEPQQTNYLGASTEDHEPFEVIMEVLAQNDDQSAMNQSGDVAAPDQPSQPEIAFERLSRPVRPVEPRQEFERQRKQPDGPEAVLPDVSEFAENAEPEAASPADNGLIRPVKISAMDPGEEIDTVFDRTEVDSFQVQNVRIQPESGSTKTEALPFARKSVTGRTDRIGTRVNMEMEEATIDLANVDSPDTVDLKPLEVENVVRNRPAPFAGSEPAETASTDLAIRPEHLRPAYSLERRLPRRELVKRNNTITTRPSRIPSKNSRTPIPLSSSYEDIQVEPVAPVVSDELRTASEMVEMSVNQTRRHESQPGAYRLRSREYRRDAVWKFGGTERSEATVERSLRWLARVQSSSGRWDADAWGAGQVEVDDLGVQRDFAGHDADTGITALVTLAFLGAGYTHEDGRYAIQVDRALDWLISQQDKNGSLAGNARRYARMYCHAMATYAIAEALGMQKESVLAPVIDPDLLAPGPSTVSVVASVSGSLMSLSPAVYGTTWTAAVIAQADSHAWSIRRVHEVRLRSALQNAVRYTIHQQHVGGGWRYSKGQEGDVSMFGWQVMALRSAEIADVTIPNAVRERMLEFINSVRQGKRGGLFSYRRDEAVTPAMTAEALFCQEMLGFRRNTAMNRESVRYLLNNLPRLSELNMYYWYYGTLAMYQYGGKPWEQWNTAVRDTLVGQQVSNGENAGSWDPIGPWGRYGGRLYATALATLTLEVYYRLLPLYQLNEVSGR